MRLAASAAVWLALLASPALAADPIMPLSEVKRGMQCEGRSVFHGTAIEPFAVEVLDVLAPSAEGGAAILIRASGPVLADGGLGYGFSGSPVYCPDDSGLLRNAGAVAAGLGDADNAIALATPIEDILRTPVTAPARARPARPGASRARPWALPLTLAGPGPAVRNALFAAARRRGLELLLAPARASQAGAPAELEPGSAVAAALSTGHVGLSGIGTVAYRDGDAIWAFGHPFEAVGPRALLLQHAFVHAVVANAGGGDAGTYKLASAGAVAGRFVFDGFSAVSGLLGEPPRTTAVDVAASGPAGPLVTSRSRVADESGFGYPAGFPPLSLVTSAAVADRAYAALQSAAGSSHGSLCTRIALRERERPLGFCNRYAGVPGVPGGPQDAMAADAALAASLVERYDRSPLHVDRVRVSLELAHGLRFAVLRGAAGPRRVRPGQRIRLRLRVQRPRQPAMRVSFRYRVPRSLGPGIRTLRLTGASADPDGGSLDGVFGAVLDSESDELVLEGGGGGAPRTIRGLARAVRSIHRFDGIRGTFRRLSAAASGRAAGPPIFRHPRLRIGGRAKVRFRVLPRQTRRSP